jgi:hypothetical protein
LLLSLVYRKVTCDISKSKKPVTDFSLSFHARSETGANRQRNDLEFEIRYWEGLGVLDVCCLPAGRQVWWVSKVYGVLKSW